MKQKKSKSFKNLDNFAKFLGELYVSQSQIIDTKFMTDFLNFLNEKSQFIILTSTLKVCGYFYELKNRSHFKNLMKSIAFRPIVEDEITKISENFDNKSDIFASRLFKPSKNAEISGNLNQILTGIAENKNVDFDYEINKISNINTRILVDVIAEVLQKPDANVIEVAKFLKTLYDLSSKITNFIHILKENLRSRILDMSANDSKKMRILGKLTAELRNLSVTNDETQKLWLEKIETFDLDNNLEVIEVYIDVVKAMLIDIQTFQLEKLQDIHKYLENTFKTLESSTSATAIRIKSKITKTFFERNILKTITPSTSELLFKIRFKHKIEGLPNKMPEKNPNILDVRDFGIIFCIAAVSNHHFTANFARSIKILKAGPNGEIFIQSFRTELSSNLFPSIFNHDFFESDEANGTFELIFQLFKEEFLTELEIISFLEILLKVENFNSYKDCAAGFIVDLQLFIVRQTRRNHKKFSEKLKSCVENAQKKLKILNGKVMKGKKFTSSKLTQNAADCKPQSIKNQLISPKNQQQATDPPDESLHVFFPKTQKIQTPWSNVCHLLKNIELDSEDIEKDTLLYDQLYPEEQLDQKQQAVKGSRRQIVKLNFADLIQQSFLSNADKKAKQSAKIFPELTTVQSKSKTDTKIQEFCQQILSSMTASSTEFRKHGITIYSWKNDDSSIKSQEKELIGLLSKQFQINHKQLLAEVFKELTNEYDVLRKGQRAKEKANQFSSSKNSFILTFRAVALFLLKSQIYNILDSMLNHIRDGNKIALELFLDITENIEYIIEESNKERDSFVLTCIDVLEYAASFRKIDEVTLGRVKKMTQFLKNLNIQYKVIPSQMVYTKPESNAFVNSLFKKPGQKSKKSKLKHQIIDTSENSSQMSVMTSQFTEKSSSSTGKSSQLCKKSSEQKSQLIQNSSKQSSQAIKKSKRQLSQVHGKPNVLLSQVIKNLNEKSSQVAEKSNGHSSQVDDETNGQSCQVSGNSNKQSGQHDEKLFFDQQIVIEDPPASLKDDDQVKFYLNQLQKSNTYQMVSKIYPFLNKNLQKLKFLDFLIQLAISNEKNIEPVIDLFQSIYGKKTSRKDKRLITAEVFKEFISLCRNGVNLEEKVNNFEKFTNAFESNFQGPFWYQFWGKLFDLIKQDYPYSLNVLVLSMHAKIDMFHKVREFKKLMKNILDLLMQKSILEQDENLKEKMNRIKITLELATVEIKNKNLKKIFNNCQVSTSNEVNDSKIRQLENVNPNWIALQKQIKYRPNENQNYP